VQPQNIIAFILYFSFIAYVIFGAYSYVINSQSRSNRIFGVLCLCFALWAFSFAVMTAADNLGEAYQWRRISVLGWGVAYSILVHFISVFTGSALSRPEQKTLLVLLYLPALITMIVFGLDQQTAAQQIQLVQTGLGWTALPVNNFWEFFFDAYFITYSLGALVMIIRVYHGTSSRRIRKILRELGVSLGVSLLLGTFTDSLSSYFLGVPLPSLAPVFILIPVTTIYMNIRRYGLLKPMVSRTEYQEGIILNPMSWVKLFHFVGLLFLGGSCLNFIIEVVTGNHGVMGIAFSFLLALGGVFLTIVPFRIRSEKRMENILTVILLLAMPVVMLIYFDGPFTNIVWPVPILVIMITVIFNSRFVFFGIAIESFLLGLLYWMRIPMFVTTLGIKDYLLRMCFIAIGIALTGFISAVYVNRLLENKKNTEYQQLISEFSTAFVTMTGQDFQTRVADFLKESGRFMNCDRAFLASFSADQETAYVAQEWIREERQQIKTGRPLNPIHRMEWSRQQLLDNQVVCLMYQNRILLEAEEDERVMRNLNIPAIILIPLHNREKVTGFIGFQQEEKGRRFRMTDFELLRVLANILGDALVKVETEKNMNMLAFFDHLTGLPNRLLFRDRLEQAIDLARRSGKYLGVLFLDLDGFKEVNDSFGHDWGDQLLVQIGNRLSSSVRKYDTVARFGGDEFLILIQQLPQKKELEEIVRKIMGVFKQPVHIGEQEFYVNASCGVALFPEDGDTVNVLIRNADLAMYAAKNNGKGQYAFCTDAMKNSLQEKVMLSNHLHHALARNEMTVHYQPQVNVVNQEIVGFEALLRWQHPVLGNVSPALFIPIAEEAGLMTEIGKWVLMTACKQNRAWQEKGFKPVQMAVNLSIEQFKSDDLAEIVKECLTESGLEPQYLELEITENMAMKESRHVLNSLLRLKEMGVAISIDNFGTEFSSLARLKDLPVDRLKIDIEFIRGIAVNPKDESIIAVMIHLAKRLGMKIIAEGVETEIQLGFLRQEDCDEIQGHYYYRPLSKEEVEWDIYRISTKDLKADFKKPGGRSKNQ
jgi:diguanylate cyclase (GGDEF)-like protein